MRVAWTGSPATLDDDFRADRAEAAAELPVTPVYGLSERA